MVREEIKGNYQSVIILIRGRFLVDPYHIVNANP